MTTSTTDEIRFPDFVIIRIIRDGKIVAEQTYN